MWCVIRASGRHGTVAQLHLRRRADSQSTSFRRHPSRFYLRPPNLPSPSTNNVSFCCQNLDRISSGHHHHYPSHISSISLRHQPLSIGNRNSDTRVTHHTRPSTYVVFAVACTSLSIFLWISAVIISSTHGWKVGAYVIMT